MAVSRPGTPVPGKHHRRQKGDGHRGAPRCVPHDTEQGGPGEAVTCWAQGGRPAARAPRQSGHRSSDLTGSTVRTGHGGRGATHVSVSEALATPDAGGPQQGCGQRFLRVLFFCCQITYERNDLKT